MGRIEVEDEIYLDGTGLDGKRWDGMGAYETGPNGWGWDGTGQNGTEQERIKWDRAGCH